MRILFCDWTTFADRDIVEAFHSLGHEVVFTSLNPEFEEPQSYLNQCVSQLSEAHPDYVFSSNFAPLLAEACHQVGVKYMSWVYDSPQLLLYKNSICYDTSHVFLFDSMQYQQLKACGVPHVYYLPLAVNTSRLDKMHADARLQHKYECDIAFVGSLYNEEHNFYDRMACNLSEYDKGYLEALLNAQRNIYGYYFLEKHLAEYDILDRMYDAMPVPVEEDSFVTLPYIYGNYFLGRKLAELERLDILMEVSKRYKVHAYTEGDTSKVQGLVHMGPVNYYDEMPYAFRYGKINLNMTLRTIQNGIPLRCFDIMGAGGFLLTNYQMDFEGLFENGVDYVYYESKEDMLDKIAYYLEHEEKRVQIAQNGHAKVKAEHSYQIRLKQMLEMLGKGER